MDGRLVGKYYVLPEYEAKIMKLAVDTFNEMANVFIPLEDTAAYLKRYRTEKGMTPLQFARKIGVTEEKYKKWESGETKPTMRSLRKIENVMMLAIYKENFSRYRAAHKLSDYLE